MVADEVRTGPDSGSGSGGGMPWMLVAVAGMLALGLGAFVAMRSAAPPAPAPDGGEAPEVAATPRDPLIESGRAVYQERCVSCHGSSGRGDGPVAKAMGTMVPANLVDADWKHGDTPERVLAVLNNGVKDTSMPGYRGIVPEDQLKAVAAYVYHLGGEPVPDALR